MEYTEKPQVKVSSVNPGASAGSGAMGPGAGGTGSAGAGGSFPWGALFILVIGPFMAILDSSIVNVALAKLMSIFGVGAEDIQWIMTAYLLASGVVIPVTAYLGDTFGYKRIYIYSLASFTLGSVLCAFAWNNNSMIVFRVIQAIGGGMLVPLSMGMLYQLIPHDKIGMAMGMWGISALMAPALGPTLGGYLVDYYSWHWIFLINLPIGVMAILLTAIFIKETPRRKAAFDIVGFILCSVGCFCILLALSKGEDKGWTSQYIVTLLVIAIYAFILFFLWEKDHPHPMLNVRLLANPIFSLSLLITAIITIGLFAVIFLIPIFAQTIMGLTPMQTGLLLMPMALTSGIMMPISGRIYDKVGAAIPGTIGLIIVIVTTWWLKEISVDTSREWLQHLLILRAFGMGLAAMPISTAGLNALPPFLSGQASALNNLVRQVSSSFGIAFMTYIVTRQQAVHWEGIRANIGYASPLTVQVLEQARGSLHLSVEALLGLVGARAQMHCMALAMGDAFVVAALISVSVLPLVLLLTRRRIDEQRQREMARMRPLAAKNGGS